MIFSLLRIQLTKSDPEEILMEKRIEMKPCLDKFCAVNRLMLISLFSFSEFCLGRICFININIDDDFQMDFKFYKAFLHTQCTAHFN